MYCVYSECSPVSEEWHFKASEPTIIVVLRCTKNNMDIIITHCQYYNDICQYYNAMCQCYNVMCQYYDTMCSYCSMFQYHYITHTHMAVALWRKLTKL